MGHSKLMLLIMKIKIKLLSLHQSAVITVLELVRKGGGGGYTLKVRCHLTPEDCCTYIVLHVSNRISPHVHLTLLAQTVLYSNFYFIF